MNLLDILGVQDIRAPLTATTKRGVIDELVDLLAASGRVTDAKALKEAVWTREQMRTTAHRIADFVYEKLTGEKGVFSTRIAFVVKRGSKFELQIADADGAGEETALASFEPIISPAWSPDGHRLGFVSLGKEEAIVLVATVAGGPRRHEGGRPLFLEPPLGRSGPRRGPRRGRAEAPRGEG